MTVPARRLLAAALLAAGLQVPVLQRFPVRRPFAAALLLAAGLALAVGAPAAASLPLAVGLPTVPAAQPMPIMATVGCVERSADGRVHLLRATEPEALQERLPEQPPADAPLGARTIRLIGTIDEFGVPDRAGHKVWAQGLLNPAPAGGADLLNVTSVTTLSDRCEP